MAFNISYDLPNSKRMDLWSTHSFRPAVYTKEIYKSVTQSQTDESKVESSLIISPQEFYDKNVARTAEQCLIEASAPQRSKLWHDARRFCITASSFGAAVGNNPYCSPENLILEKLWATFQGSEATAYGTFHELDAQNSLLKALSETTWLTDLYPGCTSHKFIEVGLLKHHDQPWIAVSPDGILVLDGPNGPKVILVEFKCPASQRDCALHPYKRYKNCIPEYYLDQIQGIMGLLSKYPSLLDIGACKCTEALFVVWQPDQIHVTRVPYDHEYYLKLEHNLKLWHDKFIQYATAKFNGLLAKNTLESIVCL